MPVPVITVMPNESKNKVDENVQKLLFCVMMTIKPID